jgi:cell division protein FtsL
VNGFSSGAASAVSGAAAGLASSVTAVFAKRSEKKKNSNQRPKVSPKRKPSKRQAMLTLSRVEPWSVMKFSFVASVVAFVILFVAVAVLYMVLSALGVFDSLQNTVTNITSGQGTAGTNISHYFSASLILGYTAMLGALNIVLITAMSTVGSVVYNLIAKTIGGIEVTLRETD